MRRIMWLAVPFLACATAVSASDAASLMTQGKLDADMGRRPEAAKAFESVANEQTAPPALRAEALVRLGLVRRDGGDAKGAARAFARVLKEHRQDKDAMAQLVQALGEALPGPERWSEVWQEVVVVIDPGQGLASARVEWPGVPVRHGLPTPPPAPRLARSALEVRARTGSSPGIPGFEVDAGARRQDGDSGPAAITLNFKDGDLQDVFRLFADITGRNVVVHPGVSGMVTFQCKDMRWDEALGRILAPNGLSYALSGPVLEIARPEELPPPRRFEGRAVSFDFKALELREALKQAAQHGGRSLSAPPGIRGSVTIKLVGVPWDQAFDLVARLNGLAWRDDGSTIRVGLRGDLR